MRPRGVGWFSQLDPNQQQVLLEGAQQRSAKTADRVVRRGSPAEELFVVVSGKLKVGVVTANGRETTFDILGPDDVFGEVGLFAGGLRTADVSAVEDCEFYVLRRGDLTLAIRKEPSIASVLLQVMAERITSLSDDVEESSSLDAGTRFARSILKLADRFGVEPLPKNLRVQLKLSQQELADLVGVSRVFANGRLKAWQAEGILTHRSGQLTVHDLGALRRVAGFNDASA